jgi:hypothetical protein
VSESRRHAAIDTIAANNPEGLLYGMVITAAVLSTTAPHVDRAGRVVAVALFVVGIYWLADVYVRTFAYHFGGRQMSLGWRLRSAARHEASVLLGGAPALAVTVATYAAGLDLSVAVNWGLWLTAAELAVLGYLSARHAGAGMRTAVGEAGVAGLLGVAMIVVKGLLH